MKGNRGLEGGLALENVGGFHRPIPATPSRAGCYLQWLGSPVASLREKKGPGRSSISHGSNRFKGCTNKIDSLRWTIFAICCKFPFQGTPMPIRKTLHRAPPSRVGEVPPCTPFCARVPSGCQEKETPWAGLPSPLVWRGNGGQKDDPKHLGGTMRPRGSSVVENATHTLRAR